MASRSKLAKVERAPFWGILRFIALLCARVVVAHTLPLSSEHMMACAYSIRTAVMHGDVEAINIASRAPLVLGGGWGRCLLLQDIGVTGQ
eukprot:COSAG01_NODE_32464_length_580_cov_22.000000_1_plen_90_part_00